MVDVGGSRRTVEATSGNVWRCKWRCQRWGRWVRQSLAVGTVQADGLDSLIQGLPATTFEAKGFDRMNGEMRLRTKHSWSDL
ncbi:hypothetical protein ACLOJK_008034 [Asimina triloba]